MTRNSSGLLKLLSGLSLIGMNTLPFLDMLDFNDDEKYITKTFKVRNLSNKQACDSEGTLEEFFEKAKKYFNAQKIIKIIEWYVNNDEDSYEVFVTLSIHKNHYNLTTQGSEEIYFTFTEDIPVITGAKTASKTKFYASDEFVAPKESTFIPTVVSVNTHELMSNDIVDASGGIIIGTAVGAGGSSGVKSSSYSEANKTLEQELEDTKEYIPGPVDTYISIPPYSYINPNNCDWLLDENSYKSMAAFNLQTVELNIVSHRVLKSEIYIHHSTRLSIITKDEINYIRAYHDSDAFSVDLGANNDFVLRARDINNKIKVKLVVERDSSIISAYIFTVV